MQTFNNPAPSMGGGFNNVMPMPIMDGGFNMGMPQQQQSRSMTMPNNNSMGGFNNMPIVMNNGEHREPQVYILPRSVPTLISRSFATGTGIKHTKR